MKTLLILSLVLTVSAPGAVQDKGRDVVLDTGVKLHIKEILFSRILPTAYYDQAMASIPAVYPKSEIVAARRFGRFGNNPAASYSMVCYKQSADVDEVTISGIVVSDGKAWSFDTKVNSSLFIDTLIHVLETVAHLPSNHSLQSDPFDSAYRQAQGFAPRDCAPRDKLGTGGTGRAAELDRYATWRILT